MSKDKFELVFVGGVSARYRRFHATFEAAKARALEVLASIEDRAADPAIIYGPDCGPDGATVA